MINHPSYMPNTGALAQIVSDAIRKSIEEQRIVHLEHSDDLESALREECEGEEDTGAGVELWGETSDGEPWRIHLDH